MKSIKHTIVFGCILCLSLEVCGQEKVQLDHTGKLTLLSGMIQPVLLRGVNLAATYFTNRISFEYSHGMFLHYPKLLRKDDNLTSLYSKWSTGAGIGYRFSTRRDLRLEVKAHHYEAEFANDIEVKYTVYSLGLGFYSRKYLWNSNWLLEYSLRYWPNVSSTLENNEYQFIDGQGNTVTHKAHQLGLIFNVSIGYTFKKTK